MVQLITDEERKKGCTCSGGVVEVLFKVLFEVLFKELSVDCCLKCCLSCYLMCFMVWFESATHLISQ